MEVAVEAEVSVGEGTDAAGVLVDVAAPLPTLPGVELAETFSEIGVEVPATSPESN